MPFDPITAIVLLTVVLIIACCIVAAVNRSYDSERRPNKTVTVYAPDGSLIRSYKVPAIDTSRSRQRVDLIDPESKLPVTFVNTIVVIEDEDHFPLHGPNPTHLVRLYGGGKTPIREFNATQIEVCCNTEKTLFVDVKTHCHVTVVGSVEIVQLPRAAKAELRDGTT
ncbi:MAG: hypothetical protein K2X93_02660 [Candidatus Obscuribacterales bacterium]|nr:hypothetical protein [Candidatus Obscuribacterales bacterium]